MQIDSTEPGNGEQLARKDLAVVADHQQFRRKPGDQLFSFLRVDALRREDRQAEFLGDDLSGMRRRRTTPFAGAKRAGDQRRQLVCREEIAKGRHRERPGSQHQDAHRGFRLSVAWYSRPEHPSS
jgi:hypothetical protein